jgi:agmatine/peptidylarginine deiminase
MLMSPLRTTPSLLLAAVLAASGASCLPAARHAAWPVPAPAARFTPAVATADDASDPLPAPGEFDDQSALLLGGTELIAFHPRIFRDVVAAAARNLPVICLVNSDDEAQLGRSVLRGVALPQGKVRFLTVPLNTMWVRDYGPLLVRRPDGGAVALDADYSPAANLEHRPLDDAAPATIAKALAVPCSPLPLRLEGGNFLVNGEGLAVTTSSVLGANGDRAYDANAIRSILRRRLGVHDWVCLQPLEGEPTGHADMFVTLVAPDVAVVAQCPSAADAANAAILDKAARMLAGRATRRGPMQVHRIPLPPCRMGVWRSYNNVLFANGTLIVPTFADVDRRTEAAALAVYQKLLPGWKIVAVPADALAANEGLLHCVALNLPAFLRPGNLGKPLEDIPELLMADDKGSPNAPHPPHPPRLPAPRQS